jgi:hypothetical protein
MCADKKHSISGLCKFTLVLPMEAYIREQEKVSEYMFVLIFPSPTKKTIWEKYSNSNINDQ